jgi:hypothetical protein
MLETTIFGLSLHALHVLEESLEALLLARNPPLRVFHLPQPIDADH